MPPIALLGNDVVDLSTPCAVGRAGDLRFLERVLSPRERDLLSLSVQPDRDLWALWAAKEAAYKAWSRTLPGLVFSPARFEVDPRAGLVTGPGGVCPVEWHDGPGRVHCLARFAPRGRGPNLLWSVEPLGEEGPPPEGPPVSLESRRARALACRLLARAGFEGACLHREARPGHRPGPPRVVVDGWVLEEVLVSLSHDGAWVAAAIAWG